MPACTVASFEVYCLLYRAGPLRLRTNEPHPHQPSVLPVAELLQGTDPCHRYLPSDPHGFTVHRMKNEDCGCTPLV